MRILFVTPYIPSLIRVRPYNLIRALAAVGHHVHLVALQPPEDRSASVDGLRQACAHVDLFPLSRWRTVWNAARALPTALPLQAAYSRHPQAERHLQQLAASDRFDVLHIEHLRGAVLADRVRGLPRVFDSVDSITHLFEQASRMAPRLRQRLMARVDLARTRRFEARVTGMFDRTLVTSPLDAEVLARLSGRDAGHVVVIPNGVDLGYFRPSASPPDPATVVFSGKMSYHANVAAALYLAQDVMPRVWQQRPDARLLIVGKDPAPSVRALAADSRVEVTGTVADVRPHLARATVAVAPLVYGAGIQNKVLEAMASGVPVVTVPSVCNGLQAQVGREVLVGGDADELARHALSLIEDATLRQRIAAAGRVYVERHHDWSSIALDLTATYELTLRSHRSNPAPGSRPRGRWSLSNRARGRGRGAKPSAEWR